MTETGDLRWEKLDDRRDLAGEGPIWDAEAECLWWVDLGRQLVRRLAPATGEAAEWRMPLPVGAVVPDRRGGAVAALKDGFYRLDPADGAVSLIAKLNPPMPGFRLNDGKTDRAGRFLAGTFFDGAPSNDGGLFRLDRDGSVTLLDRGVAIANALCFSPDGGTMYFGETATGDLFAYDYDQATGTPKGRRLVVNTRSAFGSVPDGATVDSDGRIWVALVENCRIACLDPDGSVVRLIETPMVYPSCVAFGAAGLDVLYVTSLSEPLVGPPADNPNSGYLFALHGLGAVGVPEARFAG